MAPGGVEGSAGTSHPADLAVHQPAAQVSMAVGECSNGVKTLVAEWALIFWLEVAMFCLEVQG